MEYENYVIAFVLTLFAGLATGIGSILALLTRKTNKNVLSFILGFSAGVMIYVSLVELFPEAQSLLNTEYGEKMGYLYAFAAFLVGMLIIALIDKLIPECGNPHEIHSVENGENCGHKNNLFRMGIVAAIAIAIHNFPEGIATFASALKDPLVGLPIAIAIAIHNVPEGIAVSIPIFYATSSRKKAFFYSFLSGLAEPLGAIIGFLFLSSFFNDTVLGILLAAVAGIMVFISLDELLPSAQKYGKHHLSIYGLILGMFVMGISLVLMNM